MTRESKSSKHVVLVKSHLKIGWIPCGLLAVVSVALVRLIIAVDGDYDSEGWSIYFDWSKTYGSIR